MTAENAEKLLRACRNELYGSAPDELIDRIDAYLAAAPAAAHTDHPMRHWDRTCPACIAESGSQPRSDCGGYAGGKPFTGITPPRSDTPETDVLGILHAAEGSKGHGAAPASQYGEMRALCRSLEQRLLAILEALKQVGGSSALGWMQSARKWQQRAEQEQKDSDQGWQAFYALRKQVAADKYTELTNVVRGSRRPEGSGGS